MIPRVAAVATLRRSYGREVELADGSVWRETRAGWLLVRLPTAHNTAACRGLLRERGSAEAAAWAMPPARPCPLPPPLRPGRRVVLLRPLRLADLCGECRRPDALYPL